MPPSRVKNAAIWKDRIRLYETMVKSILRYNCGTWGLSQNDQKKLNSFHRKQLRRVIVIRWPHKITNRKLYDITGTKPLSIGITERRWNLLGHILRLTPELVGVTIYYDYGQCPARNDMRYFFEQMTTENSKDRKER